MAAEPGRPHVYRGVAIHPSYRSRARHDAWCKTRQGWQVHYLAFHTLEEAHTYIDGLLPRVLCAVCGARGWRGDWSGEACDKCKQQGVERND